LSPAWAVATAVGFVWLGMVLAISFLEAPLKFRAPGVTLRIGLAIGRLVFRALNAAELVLAAALLISALVYGPPAAVLAGVLAVVVVLALQLLVVRPRLARRSRAVLAGADAPRSHAHYAYVALEVVKVVGLAVSGSLLLQAA
jgi:hypothetical protein